MVKNIVILESKDNLRFSLIDTLTRNGYHVYPASNVLYGIELYRKAYNNGGVHAVLADIDTKTEALQYTDGYEMCEDIKKRWGDSQVKFIYMTNGQNFKGEICLQKPIVIAELEKILE